MRDVRPGSARDPAARHDGSRDRPGGRHHRRGPRVAQLADPFNLQRFVDAQAGIYQVVLDELGRGRKTSHWIWFVFPQIAGLGTSWMSRHYAIGSLSEAQAYLAHPTLGPRLLKCTQLVASAPGRSADGILGAIDAVKLRSSMTLFHRAAPDVPEFREVLDRFYAGQPDPATDALLKSSAGPED